MLDQNDEQPLLDEKQNKKSEEQVLVELIIGQDIFYDPQWPSEWSQAAGATTRRFLTQAMQGRSRSDKLKRPVLLDITHQNLNLSSLQGERRVIPSKIKQFDKIMLLASYIVELQGDPDIDEKNLLKRIKNAFKNALKDVVATFKVLPLTLPKFSGQGYAQWNLIHQLDWLVCYITTFLEMGFKSLGAFLTIPTRWSWNKAIEILKFGDRFKKNSERWELSADKPIRVLKAIGFSFMWLLFFSIPWAVGQFFHLAGNFLGYFRHWFDAASQLLSAAIFYPFVAPIARLIAGEWPKFPEYLNPVFAFQKFVKNSLLLIPVGFVLAVALIPGVGQVVAPALAYLLTGEGFITTALVLGAIFAPLAQLINGLFNKVVHEFYKKPKEPAQKVPEENFKKQERIRKIVRKEQSLEKIAEMPDEKAQPMAELDDLSHEEQSIAPDEKEPLLGLVNFEEFDVDLAKNIEHPEVENSLVNSLVKEVKRLFDIDLTENIEHPEIENSLVKEVKRLEEPEDDEVKVDDKAPDPLLMGLRRSSSSQAMGIEANPAEQVDLASSPKLLSDERRALLAERVPTLEANMNAVIPFNTYVSEFNRIDQSLRLIDSALKRDRTIVNFQRPVYERWLGLSLTPGQYELLARLPQQIQDIKIKIASYNSECEASQQKILAHKELLCLEITDEELDEYLHGNPFLARTIKAHRLAMLTEINAAFGQFMQPPASIASITQDLQFLQAWVYEHSITTAQYKQLQKKADHLTKFVQCAKQNVEEVERYSAQNHTWKLEEIAEIEEAIKSYHECAKQQMQIQLALPESLEIAVVMEQYSLAEDQAQKIIALKEKVNREHDELVALITKLETLARTAKLQVSPQLMQQDDPIAEWRRAAELAADAVSPDPDPALQILPRRPVESPLPQDVFTSQLDRTLMDLHANSIHIQAEGEHHHPNGLSYSKHNNVISYYNPTHKRDGVHSYENQKRLIEKMCMENFTLSSSSSENEYIVRGSDPKLIKKTCIVLAAMGFTPYLNQNEKYKPSVLEQIEIQRKREQLAREFEPQTPTRRLVHRA